jgi:hypothetical protein
MAMTLDGTSGITQMTGSIVMSGSTSGTTTIIPSAVAGSNTATLPAATGTVMVSGNMPAFSAYPSSNQSVTTNTFTKILFQTESFDTNDYFLNSTFTPLIAGYYQINAYLSPNVASTRVLVNIYKNGTRLYVLSDVGGTSANTSGGSALVYCNGSTDYIEIYGYIVGASPSWYGVSDSTYFNGCLVRRA